MRRFLSDDEDLLELAHRTLTSALENSHSPELRERITKALAGIAQCQRIRSGASTH